jgi:O-antigen/teichoic acid export membrane protein
MLGDREVGLFAAAVRISEMWYFVPMAIASSVFPTIVASKKLGDAVYYARLQKYFTAMLWLAISVAVVVTLLKDWIISFLYGSAYMGSANVLAIHIWAGVFVALGVSGSSWYIVENLQKYSFYRTLTGGVTNVLLNFLFIPKYGIEGTAVATVISQSLASFFFDALTKKTRPVFWIKVKALNPVAIFWKN